MKNKKIFRDIKKSDDAVVGIVVTVLLIGLFLVIMTMLNTSYIPQWLESSEADHMEDVSQQFSQLKYALDIQSIVNGSTSMTTSVTLGIKGIPFFDKGRTFDTLQIIKDAITIEFSPGGTYTSDAIIFSSGNSYFVNQIYIYEAGALIICQNDKCLMYGNPTFIVTDYINTLHTWPNIDGANITFFIPQINGLTGKTNVQGDGTYPIYTTTKDPSKIKLIYDVRSITMTNNYADINVLPAWKSLLESTLDHRWINYNIIEDGNKIKLSLPIDKFFNFNIGAKHITAQIAFGLAE